MFFSNDSNYRGGFDKYHSLFDWGDERILLRGEKSPRYAVSPVSPKRVYDYNPSAKIIWMLRNPVKRAISHYVHSVYRSGSGAIPIEEAVRNHEYLEKSNSTMAYVYRSQYEKQLMKWSKYFPHQKVVVLEELVSEPKKVVLEIYDYLGVEPAVEVDFLKHSRSKVDKVKREIELQMKINEETTRELFRLLEPTVKSIESLLGRELISWREP